MNYTVLRIWIWKVPKNEEDTSHCTPYLIRLQLYLMRAYKFSLASLVSKHCFHTPHQRKHKIKKLIEK